MKTKMKTISFETDSAQKIYDRYLRRVNRIVKILTQEDQAETLMEINSHIYEGLQQVESDEVSGLLNILEGLGEPEEFLQPLVAEKKLAEASRTFNPKLIFQAIMLNIANGIRFILFAISYLSLFSFVYLIFAKLFDPNHTGLFMKDNSFSVLGHARNISGAEEILGYWLIPLCLLACVLFYFLITLLFRWSNHQNKKQVERAPNMI